MRSQSEQEIRDCVVKRLRQLYPTARIIHELNCNGMGSRRIDVAAITEDNMIGVEIKSEKDNLNRIRGQAEVFKKVFGNFIIATHEKHLEEINNMKLCPYNKWVYPFRALCCWTNPPKTLPQSAKEILHLLWHDELYLECLMNGINVPKRANMWVLIKLLMLDLTGAQAIKSVCRQLRARNFAEADLPIFPVAKIKIRRKS